MKFRVTFYAKRRAGKGTAEKKLSLVYYFFFFIRGGVVLFSRPLPMAHFKVFQLKIKYDKEFGWLPNQLPRKSTSVSFFPVSLIPSTKYVRFFFGVCVHATATLAFHLIPLFCINFV